MAPQMAYIRRHASQERTFLHRSTSGSPSRTGNYVLGLKAQTAAPPRKLNSREEKYSLTLKEWTIGTGLPTLAKQLGLEITPWPLPDEIMERQVALKLKDVTVDEMLQLIGEQAKIGLKRVDNQIRVQLETP